MAIFCYKKAFSQPLPSDSLLFKHLSQTESVSKLTCTAQEITFSYKSTSLFVRDTFPVRVKLRTGDQPAAEISPAKGVLIFFAVYILLALIFFAVLLYLLLTTGLSGIFPIFIPLILIVFAIALFFSGFFLSVRKVLEIIQE